VDEYDGRQYVGIDLHRRRSVIVRMSAAGQRLGPAVARGDAPRAVRSRRHHRHRRGRCLSAGDSGPPGYATWASLAQIAKKLDEEQVPTPSGKGGWSRSSVQYVLRRWDSGTNAGSRQPGPKRGRPHSGHGVSKTQRRRRGPGLSGCA
jgi:hypothetical protein